ncbi:MAG TPA: hypothetical protein VFH39_01390 [Candidatus Saccharimonadales bacterium]|nr:hypothetical protein [Candidatus Saccharimonadales bacterium]
MNITKQIVKVEKEVVRDLRKLEQLEVQHRTGLERAGALALTALIAFSMADFGHGDDRRNLNRVTKEAVVNQSVVFSPAEKNETVRMPVKFDDGLRATATTGY